MLDCLCVGRCLLRPRRTKCVCRSCTILQIWMLGCPRSLWSRRRWLQWTPHHCLSHHRMNAHNHQCCRIHCHLGFQRGFLSHHLDGSLGIQFRFLNYYLVSNRKSQKPLCQNRISLGQQCQQHNSRYRSRLFSSTSKAAAAKSTVVMLGAQKKMMRINVFGEIDHFHFTLFPCHCKIIIAKLRYLILCDSVCSCFDTRFAAEYIWLPVLV